MRDSELKPSRFGILLLVAAIILGCNSVALPTQCDASYVAADGTVSPGINAQLQEAMTAAGLQGTAKASTHGERDSCGTYHAREVDFDVTLQVQSLDAGADLGSSAATVLDVVRPFVKAGTAPNLGNLRLTFQANGQECGWVYGEGAWRLGASSAGGSISCPVP